MEWSDGRIRSRHPPTSRADKCALTLFEDHIDAEMQRLRQANEAMKRDLEKQKAKGATA